MIFYRHKLTEKTAKSHCAWLTALFNEGRVICKSLKGIKAYYYYDKQYKKHLYCIVKDFKVVCFCELEKRPRWVAKEVTYLYVLPEYRGMQLAAKLYDVILADSNILISGASQNVKSRGLWLKMIKQSKHIIWAQDLLNLDRIAAIYHEDNKLICDLKLYCDLKKKPRKLKEDIRFLACTAHYANAN